MWGGSPLAPTKPAFLFLLSHASLPTTLPVSFFRFLLCRLMLGLTQVVCFAEQGAPQLVSAVLPYLSLRLLAWEKRLLVRPARAGVRHPGWLGWRSRLPWEPTGQLPCWLQRQDWASPVASHPLTASSSYSRVPRSPALEAWEGGGQRSSERGPLCPSPSLSIGLALELRQLLGPGKGRVGDTSQPPSPQPFWGCLGPACPSPSPCAHTIALCPAWALLPRPPLVSFGTAGPPAVFLQQSRGADEDSPAHPFPIPASGPPGPLRGRCGFKGGRERAVTLARFCLCAFCALSGALEWEPTHSTRLPRDSDSPTL